tara:strand:+ start:774 stop:935 length:162 start_codon:yes stop_codon:yes gene_type:complete
MIEKKYYLNNGYDNLEKVSCPKYFYEIRSINFNYNLGAFNQIALAFQVYQVLA